MRTWCLVSPPPPPSPWCLGTALHKNHPLVTQHFSRAPFFPTKLGFSWLRWMQGSYSGSVCRTTFHMCCMAIHVHLSVCFTVRKERAHIPRCGAAHGHAQEPTPGSAAKHCWFLDTGRGYHPRGTSQCAACGCTTPQTSPPLPASEICISTTRQPSAA